MHVTADACEALSELIERRGETERCLRLSTIQGNYRFILDEPIEQDVIFRHQERVVLVVSETVSRDLWGITVDCANADGRRRLIFRKARQGEPLDVVKDQNVVPPEWRAAQHERLLEEIAEIGRKIASMRGTSKSTHREQVHALEQQKQEKWDAIRALWAGDGGWHKMQAQVTGAKSGS